MGTVKKNDTTSVKDVPAKIVTAKSLTIGSSDQIATLDKLQPIILPNQSPQLYETQALKDLRTSYKYIYVINWLYHCRGFIKLQSEYFDVDIFELELLNYFPTNSFLLNAEDQPNINNLFIYKLKIHLITALQNSKLSSVNNFEKIFRLWFGANTPLGGKEEDDEGEEEEEEDQDCEGEQDRGGGAQQDQAHLDPQPCGYHPGGVCLLLQVPL
jgi:hypothetical protein